MSSDANVDTRPADTESQAGASPTGTPSQAPSQPLHPAAALLQEGRTSAPATPVAPKKSTVKVSEYHVVLFTRQLATLYKAGVAIVRALEVLAHQVDSPDFQMVIFGVNSDLLKGLKFSQALAKYPRVFSSVYLSMVRVGELEGDMGEALERIAEFMEKDYKLRQQVKSAMTYPVVVFCVALLVAFFMFNYLLPHFVKVFEEMNIELPMITKVLMATVRVAQSPMFILGMPAFCFVYYAQFKLYTQTEMGRWRWDRFKLKMPIFGKIVRKVAIARLCRSLGTLIQAGINTISALEMAGESASNEVIRLHMVQARAGLLNGVTLSSSFNTPDQLFPKIVYYMVSVGEESGVMDAMLDKLASYYEAEVNASLAELSSLLEPILIVFTGVVVGFIVLAIFMPLYGFLNQMG